MNTTFAACLSALVATTATDAGAVGLNPRGLGQVLVYPYYTVNQNQDTIVSVANQGDVGKVVKVRFREGYNGRAVLDFDLFLSAHDVWTAAVSAGGTDADAARIATSDRSCVDAWSTNPLPFNTAAYDGSSADAGFPADSGPQTPARTREGEIEILAIADIVPGSDLDAAITHVQQVAPGLGTPADCAQAPALLAAGTDVVVPTTGLYGYAAIIDVGQGTFYAYNAQALSGFTDEMLLGVAGEPGHPSLADARSATSASPAGGIATVATNDGTVSLDYARGVDAVSAVFMADALYNDYVAGAGLGANTDWVVTFPTKHFYVDQQAYPDAPIAPFEQAFAGGQSIVAANLTAWDREEGTDVPHMCIGVPEPGCFAPSAMLAHEVDVIAFTATAAATSGVLGSHLVSTAAPWGDSGSAKLLLDAPGHPHVLGDGETADGHALPLDGLPVTGFMVYNVINANALPGRLANYSGLFPHRTTLACSDGTIAGGCP